jgi:DnaJ-class molecular chaperone
MKYFENINNLEDLKKAFLRLCKELHPDNGGDIEKFKEMKQEYESLVKHLKVFGSAENMDQENKENEFDFSAFSEVLEKISGLDIDIELIGSWLWVTGNTRENKDLLKSLNFKWASKKKAWYIHFMPYVKRSRKTISLDRARYLYGSKVLKNHTPLTIE